MSVCECLCVGVLLLVCMGVYAKCKLLAGWCWHQTKSALWDQIAKGFNNFIDV